MGSLWVELVLKCLGARLIATVRTDSATGDRTASRKPLAGPGRIFSFRWSERLEPIVIWHIWHCVKQATLFDLLEGNFAAFFASPLSWGFHECHQRANHSGCYTPPALLKDTAQRKRGSHYRWAHGRSPSLTQLSWTTHCKLIYSKSLSTG